MKTNNDRGLLYVQKLGFRVARNSRAAQSVLVKKVGMEKAQECSEWFEKRADCCRDGDTSSDTEFYAFKNGSLPLSLAISEIFDADYIRRICSWLAENKECLGDKILDVGCDNGIITCFIAQICPKAKVIGLDRCKESIVSARLLAKQFNLTNVEFICDSIEKYPVKDFDTVVALRISQENVKEPVVSAYNSFFNVSAAYKEALLHHSKALLSHLYEDGNLITGQMVEPNYYWFGQMLCCADMGWFPIDCDKLQYISFEDTVPLSVMIWAQCDINKDEFPENFAENMQKESKRPFMYPYYTNYSNLFLRRIMASEYEEQKINLSDSIYFGWKANVLFEDTANELILGYTLYYRNDSSPRMYSLWKNANDTTAITYFGASHIYSNGDMNKPEPCWANMDISEFEHINQGLLELIINAAESGMIRKISILSATDDGRIIEAESSVEEITKTAKNKKYHNLQEPSGLADFLRDNIINN